ncbi:hypothetical protein BGX38DRAFT_1146949 [Terfezia claveryi]|nr:hypothetical protein BGX38DRAFT_1146949 [Terfezia claveryi]
MASSTGSKDPSSPKRKAKPLPAPSLKLKRSAALLYNYIKPKTQRSAIEIHLFQKVATVLDAMLDIEKAAMLHPERSTRSGAGPPIPSPKDIREFEAMNDTWLGHNKRSPPGELTPKPPKRTKKLLTATTDSRPQTQSAETEHQPTRQPTRDTATNVSPEPVQTVESPQSAEGRAGVTGSHTVNKRDGETRRRICQRDQNHDAEVECLQVDTDCQPPEAMETSILLHKNKPKKIVRRMAGSVVTGAFSTVGGITKAASGAINWLSQTGFENVGREPTTMNEQEESDPTGQLPGPHSPPRSPRRVNCPVQPCPRFGDIETPLSTVDMAAPSHTVVDILEPTPPLNVPLNGGMDKSRPPEVSRETVGTGPPKTAASASPDTLGEQQNRVNERTLTGTIREIIDGTSTQDHCNANKKSDIRTFPIGPTGPTQRPHSPIPPRSAFKWIETPPQPLLPTFYRSPEHYRPPFLSTSLNHNCFNPIVEPPLKHYHRGPNKPDNTDTTPERNSGTIFGFRMSQEDFKKILEEMLRPLHQKIDVVAATADNTKTANMNARKKEIEAKKKLYDEELKAIDDGTWTTPFETPPANREMVVRNQDLDKEWRKTPRFDPNTMPKFKHDDDLELWLMEMEQIIDTHGETLICPQIAFNCFPQKDPVRIWYSMLGGRNHANMTKEAGCWFNFQVKMREAWSKSISVTQREAEDRHKLPEETFLIYYFQKLRMLAMAFPESKEATHIARIRAKFNDAQADRYIREQESLSRFASEIRLYDDHLKLHPPKKPTYPSRPPYQTSSSTPYSKYQSNPGPVPLQPMPKARLLLPVTTQEGAKARDRTVEYTKRNEVRMKTIADRLNPATNKRTRSFLRSDGTVKFIERPCEFCEKLGKRDQWHFGFECGTRAAVHTVWIETLESDSDSDDASTTPHSYINEVEAEVGSGKA